MGISQKKDNLEFFLPPPLDKHQASVRINLIAENVGREALIIVLVDSGLIYYPSDLLLGLFSVPAPPYRVKRSAGFFCSLSDTVSASL
jgi:hypothetical protein